jgi:hypothetical protein
VRNDVERAVEAREQPRQIERIHHGADRQRRVIEREDLIVAAE